VELENRLLTVLDRERLKTTGEFDPLYLHQDGRGAG